MSDVCPHCRTPAPIVYRGVMAYCAGCGRPRPPLTAASVNLAGQPSKVGGSVAKVFGWLTLAGGLMLALLVAALFQALFPAGFVGWAFGGVIAVVALAVGLSLVVGGKSLSKSGVATERATRTQAIFALAANRGGMLTALDVARALGIPHPAADQLLTDLAKEDADRVKLEVDDHGGLFYVFPAHLPPVRVAPDARPDVRVDPSVAGARAPQPREGQAIDEPVDADATERPRGASRRTPS